MKVLLDHNLPHKLRAILASQGSHDVFTASYMGWGGLQNGELLRAAEENGIDVLVTGDGTLRYEQNLTGRRLAIIALSANNWPLVRECAAQIQSAIDQARPGSFRLLDCGDFSRKRSLQ